MGIYLTPTKRCLAITNLRPLRFKARVRLLHMEEIIYLDKLEHYVCTVITRDGQQRYDASWFIETETLIKARAFYKHYNGGSNG